MEEFKGTDANLPDILDINLDDIKSPGDAADVVATLSDTYNVYARAGRVSFEKIGG